MQRRARQLKNHNAEAELFRRRALVGFLGVLLALDIWVNDYGYVRDVLGV